MFKNHAGRHALLGGVGNAGVKLVLVGNPDESVQTFRGFYPEGPMRRAVEGRLKAKEEQLVGGSAVADQLHMTMADVIRVRIPLSDSPRRKTSRCLRPSVPASRPPSTGPESMQRIIRWTAR